MNKDFRKISRGQIWFLVDSDLPSVHYQDSVQGKNRPWLIVSNNLCNQNSTVYTVVPLTTAAKSDLPTHVTYKDGDRIQTILCEQLRTIPERLLYNSGSNYKYTLSEELMQSVDEALAIQLAITLVMPNADRFWKSIESMIRLKVKETLNYCKMDAYDVSKIAAIIDTKTSESVASEVAGKIYNEVPIDKHETAIVEETPTQKTESFVPIRKTKRNVWNETSKKKFLDDCYKYGLDYVVTAYNMQRTTAASTKAKFSKELNYGKT